MTHILIVDDEEFVRRSVKRLLEKTGFTVSEANGGREALALIEQHTYDILLLDLHMQDMDGLALARILRQSGRPVPAIIAMSGETETTLLEMAKALGATLILLKPFAIDQLMAAIRRVASRES